MIRLLRKMININFNIVYSNNKKLTIMSLINEGWKVINVIKLFVPDGVIGVGLWCSTTLSLLDEEVLLLTGLRGMLLPCESMMSPLKLRILRDVAFCSFCCLIVFTIVVAFDDTHKLDKSIRDPRDSRSRRNLSFSIWTCNEIKEMFLLLHI